MTCIHHWDIEPPNGPTAEGVCRHCGEVKTFTTGTPQWGPREFGGQAIVKQRTSRMPSWVLSDERGW